LESVPGLGKTMLARLLTGTIGKTKFERIQFTPDLLPTDITGVTIYEKNKGFYTQKGPIFANFVLADEINRAPPKVQAAMLQAMQEGVVTIGNDTFDLPQPFFVMATQNPLEQQGVYPLALAELDRFLFKIYLDYPPPENEIEIVQSNMETKGMKGFDIRNIIETKDILKLNELVKKIHLSKEVKEYIVNIIDATRNPLDYGVKGSQYLKWGASPRATIGLALGAKATALMNNRTFVIPEDVIEVSYMILRHRLLLNYEGSAKGVSTDEIIEGVLRAVPII
jgi:MoxR-like ATPase